MKNPNGFFLMAAGFSGATFTVLDAGFDIEQQTCWVECRVFHQPSLVRSPRNYRFITFSSSTGTWALDTASPSAGLKYDSTAGS